VECLPFNDELKLILVYVLWTSIFCVYKLKHKQLVSNLQCFLNDMTLLENLMITFLIITILMTNFCIFAALMTKIGYFLLRRTHGPEAELLIEKTTGETQGEMRPVTSTILDQRQLVYISRQVMLLTVQLLQRLLRSTHLVCARVSGFWSFLFSLLRNSLITSVSGHNPLT